MKVNFIGRLPAPLARPISQFALPVAPAVAPPVKKFTMQRTRLLPELIDDLRKEVAALRERVDVLEKQQPAPLMKRIRGGDKAKPAA